MHLGIDWNDALKKETKSSDDKSLGKIKGIYDDFILIERGVVNHETFYIHKNQATSYDGKTVRFGITEEEVKEKYWHYKPPHNLIGTDDNMPKDNADILQQVVQENQIKEKSKEDEVSLEQFYEQSRAKDNKPEDVVKYNEKFNVPYQTEEEEAETHSDKVRENLADKGEIEKRKEGDE